MNNKEEIQNAIVNIVIDCCNTEHTKITVSDLKGKSRSEILVWIRAMATSLLQSNGYLPATVCKFLNRTPASIRHLMNLDSVLKRTSRAYRIAYEEALLLCKKLEIKEQ